MFNSSAPNFLWGMTARFLFSCAAWTTLRIARAAFSGKPKESVRKAIVKNSAYFKMWASSFVLETGVSMMLLPGPYIVGRHVTRVMLDAFMPIVSDVLFKLDRFSHAAFLSFASKNLIRANPAASASSSSSSSISSPMITDPRLDRTKSAASSPLLSSSSPVTTSTGAGGAAAVSNAFLYQLPATALHLVKLLFRSHRLGMKKTRFFRCVGVIALQYVARVPLMSFATMLPMSDTELAFCVICMVIDQTSDAYLSYHTFPWPDAVSEAGISVVVAAASGGGAREQKRMA